MKKQRSSQQAVVKARDRLRAAIDRACIARGEAQWTGGFRTGAKDDQQRLWDKESRQWHQCEKAEAAVERAITAFARAVRKSR